jgi:hypothetical protein
MVRTEIFYFGNSATAPLQNRAAPLSGEGQEKGRATKSRAEAACSGRVRVTELRGYRALVLGYFAQPRPRSGSIGSSIFTVLWIIFMEKPMDIICSYYFSSALLPSKLASVVLAHASSGTA